MYKLLLTFKYLRRRLIPVFALLAVMLCTAMVIIVISVMGGFLDMLRNAGRTLMGDVSINFGLGGFPHYEELIREIELLPEAEAATPLIEAYGLLALPGDINRGVQVFGIDGEGMNRVTQFRDTLYWTKERLDEYPRVREIYEDADPVDAAMQVAVPWEPEAEHSIPIVPGLEVSPYNYRTSEGTYEFHPSIQRMRMVLTVLPVTRAGGMVQPETRQAIAINEFNSGVYEADSKQVYIPFRTAQEMMRMQAAPRIMLGPDGQPVFDAEGNVRTAGTVPARASWIYVRAASGVPVNLLRDRVEQVYQRLADRHGDMPPLLNPYAIATWEQRQAKFLAAVENERGLMTVLFGIISITAVMIVGVIFYMIVLEKTRDIGILRSIGASQAGVASIFITFAAVIGALGAAGGLILAWLIVNNINEIHAWLGRTFDIVIWDRSVYFFDRIPSRIDPAEAATIVIIAVIASLIGAIIPAFKAARVDPVESLRYE